MLSLPLEGPSRWTFPLPAGRATQTRRLAAIDIGSNSIRLLVAEAARRRHLPRPRRRKTDHPPGPGPGPAPAVLQRRGHATSLEALARMKAIADGYGVERLEVIATSAVREAGQPRPFLELVQQRLGLEIEVISADRGRASSPSPAPPATST